MKLLTILNAIKTSSYNLQLPNNYATSYFRYMNGIVLSFSFMKNIQIH